MNAADIQYLKEQVLTKKTSSTMKPLEIIQYVYGALISANITTRMITDQPGEESINPTDEELVYIALKSVVDGNMIPARANKKYRQAIINFCVNTTGENQQGIIKAAADQERLKKLKASNLKAFNKVKK
jgi:hypothetical protein